MPNSSLWLLPPPTHPLHTALTTLIRTTLPARFPREAASSARVTPHFFPAHVTLTSGIDPAVYGGESGAQAWLDETFERFFSPSSSAGAGQGQEEAGVGVGGSGGRDGDRGRGVRVRFERVVSQDVFYRRCFVRVGFEGVRELAGVARAKAVVGEGVEEGKGGEVVFGGETEGWLNSWRQEFGPHLSLMYGNEPITDGALYEVTKVVQQAGLKLSDEATEGLEQESAWDGWDGGVIWLVPTDKPISEWGKPIATRQL